MSGTKQIEARKSRFLNFDLSVEVVTGELESKFYTQPGH